MLTTVVLMLAIGPTADPTPAKGVRKLSPSLRVDIDNHKVELDAEVVFREGPLELFLCPRRTKEHESVLAAEINPRMFQLALLMAGAKPGRPAEFEPFKQPTGEKLKVTVHFERNGAKQTVEAREWVRDSKTKKAMTADFVFAGSRFQKLPEVERPIFLGDDGDLVCVSNFPGSIIDVAAKSSKENAERSFEAFTDQIPAKGTKVLVTFEPQPDGQAAK